MIILLAACSHSQSQSPQDSSEARQEALLAQADMNLADAEEVLDPALWFCLS
jgi:hypothetical protein